MKGYTYILKCNDDSYYTGSTIDLARRLLQHQSGEGANHTKKRLPVALVYYEEYDRIDTAFYREKQIQGWSRKKKEALINNMPERLHDLAKCMNETSHVGFGSSQPTKQGSAQPTKQGSAQPRENSPTENGSTQPTENQLTSKSENPLAERSRSQQTTKKKS